MALMWVAGLAVVHLFAAALFVFLFRRGTPAVTRTSSITYGVASVALSLQHIAAAMMLGVDDPCVWSRATSAWLATGWVSISGFVLFWHHISGAPSPRAVRVTVAAAAVFVVAAIGGVFVDPAVSQKPLPIVRGPFILGALPALYTAWRLSLQPRPGPKLIAISLLAVTVVWALDLYYGASWSLYAVELLSSAFGLACAVAGMAQVTDALEELEVQTEQLRRSYHELQRVEEELVEKEQLAVLGELSGALAGAVNEPSERLRLLANRLEKDPERGEILSRLDDACAHLDLLVSDLLVYARKTEVRFEVRSILDCLGEAQDRVGGVRIEWLGGVELAQFDPALGPHVFEQMLRAAQVQGISQLRVSTSVRGNELWIRFEGLAPLSSDTFGIAVAERLLGQMRARFENASDGVSLVFLSAPA